MNKKLLLLIAISVITTYTFAQAPDMEFFAPTEYMYMTELAKTEVFRRSRMYNTPECGRLTVEGNFRLPHRVILN